MTKFERVLSDEEITSIVFPCDWSGNKDQQMACITSREVEQAVLAKLAEQEPVMFARTYNGEIDWDEDCVTEDDDGLLLDGLTHVNDDGDFEVEEGYAAIPLYAHPCVSQNGRCETQTKNVESSNITKLSLSVDTKEVQALLQSYLDGLDGWQLVPKEPTDEMKLDAIYHALNATIISGYNWHDYMSDIYKIMLKAAPKHTGENNGS